MSEPARVRVGFIGLGVMARWHLAQVIANADCEVVAVCEPSPDAYAATVEMFREQGLPLPPNEPDWTRFVETYRGRIDAVSIVTPHALHFAQATACLEAGMDVFLEKPMVMRAEEAIGLIDTRDRTGRLLVVAFQGSLSPQIREAARLLHSGVLGTILNVNAMVWQDWAAVTRGGWRQDPSLSGGGFLFDTGAHMLNTVGDLVGEEIAEVAAWLEDDGYPVDVRAVIMGRTRRGTLVTMNACGLAIPSCHSDIRVFTSQAILRTGVWGEALEIQRYGRHRLRRVSSIATRSIWQQFMDIRAGRSANPTPPEVGLRMARLWDAIRESAARGGTVVTTDTESALTPTPAPLVELAEVVPMPSPELGTEAAS
ncbi:MAG TPA: Gfo/Idh/MocA family oxidoreductase [Candidatus Limnocylindrales bacterium]|jgi:predicted dehydrogenase